MLYKSAEQIIDLFQKKSARGIVNAAAIEVESSSQLTPYIKLAENIGTLLPQLIKGQLKQININFSGDLLHSASTLITTSFLKDFFPENFLTLLILLMHLFLQRKWGL